MDKEERQMNEQMQREFEADQNKKLADTNKKLSVDEIKAKLAAANLQAGQSATTTDEKGVIHTVHTKDNLTVEEMKQKELDENNVRLTADQIARGEGIDLHRPLTPEEERIKAVDEQQRNAERKAASVPTEAERKTLARQTEKFERKQARRREITARLKEILDEDYGGLESNVPAVAAHEYWTLLAEYRAL